MIGFPLDDSTELADVWSIEFDPVKEASATNGPNVVELPSMPINTAWVAMNCQ